MLNCLSGGSKRLVLDDVELNLSCSKFLAWLLSHGFLEGCQFTFKVEKSLKGRLDSNASPSPSVKIQIMGGKMLEV